jgi:hypothetical protein
MMQNSLDRVLVGIATTLHDDVLPHVDDTYARSQVEAAVELIVSLTEQTEWRCDVLHATTEELRAILVAADRAAPADEPEMTAARALIADPAPHAADNAALVALHGTSVAALAGVQRWLARRVDADDPQVAAIAAAVDDFVRRQFTSDLDRYAAIRRRVRAVVTPSDR